MGIEEVDRRLDPTTQNLIPDIWEVSKWIGEPKSDWLPRVQVGWDHSLRLNLI